MFTRLSVLQSYHLIPSIGNRSGLQSQLYGSAYPFLRLSTLECLTSLTCKYLLCPLLTSVQRSEWIAPSSVSISRDIVQISQGKTRNFRCVNAGFIKHTPLQMEDFVVTCPLVPGVPHLRSGSCTPDQVRGRLASIFGLGFLQTPPHSDALALLLTFGSANTWCEDFHLTSFVPCLAHMSS
jgi:hypothetical protein